ncbi:MAG: hypothetical protein AAB316_10370, partial [Bacteroidota bacterium]
SGRHFHHSHFQTITAMNIKESLKKYYKKHGKKALVIFLIYFVTKWTLTIIFGAKIIAWLKDVL